MIVSSANRRAKCSGNTMCTNRVCLICGLVNLVYICAKNALANYTKV